MKVGFIGLGNMGSGMAANLLKAGHTLTVYNRTSARAEALVAQGATLAKTPSEAAWSEVVITMLADDAAVESVVFGVGGVLAGLKTGSIHISMSTISVALAEQLASAHQAAGQRFVAAPVFGRPEAASAGKLFIVAGVRRDASAFMGTESILLPACPDLSLRHWSAHACSRTVKRFHPIACWSR